MMLWLGLLLFGLQILLAWQCWQMAGATRRQLIEGQRYRIRLLQRKGEADRLRANQKKLSEYQKLAEDTIEGSTQAARLVHKEVANIPFEIFESIPATRDTAKLARGVHDLTADSVYGAISGFNKLFGKGSRAGLGVKDDEK